jgi:hypothetical protein
MNTDETAFIDINCYELNDTKLESPTQITLPIKDLKTNLYKENDQYLIKYFQYKFDVIKQQLYNKTECIVKIKPEEYKKLKKLL